MRSRKPRLSQRQVERAASVWLARLRADERTAGDEAAFQAWIEQDPRNAHVFHRITATWEAAGGVHAPIIRARHRRRRALQGRLVAACVVVAALVSGAAIYAGVTRSGAAETTYATGPGEVRRLTLSDGSVLVLDARTQVTAALGRGRRKLALLSGRARFDVAHDPRRPFVVNAGGREVTALGTMFEVTQDPRGMSVTLIGGHVQVTGPAVSRHGSWASLMEPGDRLVVSATGDVVHGRVGLADVGSWERGVAVFNDTPLADAVDEINRYASRPIRIEGRKTAVLRVTGAYQTRDVDTFARDLEVVLPVLTTYRSDEIIISPRGGG